MALLVVRDRLDGITEITQVSEDEASDVWIGETRWKNTFLSWFPRPTDDILYVAEVA